MGWKTFSVKGPIIGTLDFASHETLSAVTHFCFSSTKEAVDSRYVKECSFILILCSQNQAAALMWPVSHNLTTSILEYFDT